MAPTKLPHASRTSSLVTGANRTATRPRSRRGAARLGWRHSGVPRLAALVRERLVNTGVLLVVTLRRDGSPRLSPVEPCFHLFVVGISEVSFIRYASTGDQYVGRWPAGVEFVRRATSPTSVGEPESVTEFRPVSTRCVPWLYACAPLMPRTMWARRWPLAQAMVEPGRSGT